MIHLWSLIRHRLLGCDWDGCRCRVCRMTRETGHEWEGCKCKRCPRTRHDWDGCRCRRCDGERHEWQGTVCRLCGCREDLRALLLSHFPQEGQAIEQVLAKLNAVVEDWSAIYDWQVVELAREAIPCCHQAIEFDVEVTPLPALGAVRGRSESAAGGHSETGRYVAPSPLRLNRRGMGSSCIIC